MISQSDAVDFGRDDLLKILRTDSTSTCGVLGNGDQEIKTLADAEERDMLANDLPSRAPDNIADVENPHASPSHFGEAGLTDEGDFDFARICKLLFECLCNVATNTSGSCIVGLFRVRNHA